MPTAADVNIDDDFMNDVMNDLGIDVGDEDAAKKEGDKDKDKDAIKDGGDLQYFGRDSQQLFNTTSEDFDNKLVDYCMVDFKKQPSLSTRAFKRQNFSSKNFNYLQ